MRFDRETFCENAFLAHCQRLVNRGERHALRHLRFPEPPAVALRRAGTLRALDFLIGLIHGEELTFDDLLDIKAHALEGAGANLWGPGEHVTVAMLDLLNFFGVEP